MAIGANVTGNELPHASAKATEAAPEAAEAAEAATAAPRGIAARRRPATSRTRETAMTAFGKS